MKKKSIIPKLLIFTIIFNVNLSAELEIKQFNEKHLTSFAIFIDRETFNEVSDGVYAYRDAIELDGLSTYILINDWKNPEEIKKEIEKLYHSNPPLEGVVFIGDIPIPMIRDAQHLTSAFKMDQDRYPWFRSSVPSDRFYDDLDLKFNYLGNDSINKLYFYYSLLHDSPQRISKEIYSGRIKPSINDESKYEIIKNYLFRVAKQKMEKNSLDKMLVFTGHGYTSESLSSWANEYLMLREEFPQIFKPGGRLKFLNYTMSSEMKEIIISEIQNPELDLAVFHAHGHDDTQYLLEYPLPKNIDDNIESVKLYLRSKLRQADSQKKSIEETKEYFKQQFNVPNNWFDGAFLDSVITADSLLNYKLDIYIDDVRNIAPQAKLIIFDQCFNGSFHKSPYIAGEYVMGKGTTVVGIANSVNVLQDIYANEFIGILALGIRVGQFHRFNNFLESHIIGDPTFHFANSYEYNLDHSNIFNLKYASKWEKYLNSNLDALRAIAVYMMYKNFELKFENNLVEIYKNDPASIVRMQALKCLAEIKSKSFENILLKSIYDPNEYIRRLSVQWIGKIANEEYLQHLAFIIINDESQRISFNTLNAMSLVNPKKAIVACEKIIAEQPISNVLKEKLRNMLVKSLNRSYEWLFNDLIQNITNDTLSLKKKISDIRTFRKYTYIDAIPTLVAIAKNKERNISERVAVIEALGWYNFIHNRDIVMACQEIKSAKETPNEVKDEANKTLNRIIIGPNNVLIP